MKKSARKLKLHRETVSRLDASVLGRIAGGDETWEAYCTIHCVSGPLYECFGTFEASCRC
jgi:hypothetical protein